MEAGKSAGSRGKGRNRVKRSVAFIFDARKVQSMVGIAGMQTIVDRDAQTSRGSARRWPPHVRRGIAVQP